MKNREGGFLVDVTLKKFVFVLTAIMVFLPQFLHFTLIACF